MLRLLPLTLFIALATDFCLGEKGVVNVPQHIGAPLRSKLNTCGEAVNSAADDVLEQIYQWDLKSEDTVKDFLYCFFERKDANTPKFDPGNLIAALGDFEQKEEVGRVLQNCNESATGSDVRERIFAFTSCFMRDTPVIIKI